MSNHRRRRRGRAPVSPTGQVHQVIFAVTSSDEEDVSAVELTGREEEILYERPHSAGLLFDTFELLNDLGGRSRQQQPEKEEQEEARFRPLPENFFSSPDSDSTDDYTGVSCFPRSRVSIGFERAFSSAKLRIRTATRTRRQRNARARENGDQSIPLTTRLDAFSKEKGS